jgi:hypothetical protein
MATRLSFKDFTPVDYVPSEDPLINVNAKKRKQLIGLEDVEKEALSLATRRKMGIRLKRNKARIAMGRKKAARRMASQDTLKQRARKQARNMIFKKLSKGEPRASVSPQRRAEIEKRMSKLKGRIDKIATRILPKVRKMEIARKKGQAAKPGKTQAGI